MQDVRHSLTPPTRVIWYVFRFSIGVLEKTAHEDVPQIELGMKGGSQWMA